MTNLLIEALRAEALTVDCDYCGREAGQRCVNPTTSDPLEKQIAHQVRIKKAGMILDV
ncbi:MAG: zinc finger domain-containing protein [Pseudonocardiaceae bacterium]